MQNYRIFLEYVWLDTNREHDRCGGANRFFNDMNDMIIRKNTPEDFYDHRIITLYFSYIVTV